MHVASAGVGRFALLVVVVFSLSLGMTFSYLSFFFFFFGIYVRLFFFALKRYLFPCIRYSALTLRRTRGDKGEGGGCHPF